MKGLAIEIIFKWLLVLVIVFIAFGLIITFSDNIRKFLENLLQKDETTGGRVVQSESFSSSQVKTYIKACWDRYQTNRVLKEVVCFVLKGDVSNVDSSSLSSTLQSENMIDTSKFDNSKTTTVIKSTGNRILVESL